LFPGRENGSRVTKPNGRCVVDKHNEVRPTGPTLFSSTSMIWAGADVGHQSSEFYETPNINPLAASGTVFTDAYSRGPNYAPSRA